MKKKKPVKPTIDERTKRATLWFTLQAAAKVDYDRIVRENPHIYGIGK